MAIPRRSLVCGVMLIISMIGQSLFAQTDGVQADNDELVETSQAIDRLSLPSISATHTRLHEPSGQQIMTAFIEISPHGLRVKDSETRGVHEMLHDFVGERGWLLDHERSVSHRVPLVSLPELGASSPGQAASFLGPYPCGYLRAEEQGAGRWRGRAVDTFNCVNDSGAVLSVEFVDHVYGIVVFLQTKDGYVDELSNLTDRVYSGNHFVPPDHYREVEKSEFFFGAPDLPLYKPAEK